MSAGDGLLDDVDGINTADVDVVCHVAVCTHNMLSSRSAANAIHNIGRMKCDGWQYVLGLHFQSVAEIVFSLSTKAGLISVR